MTEKVFYASDIEYQQLEDDIMGTTFDVLPYHPAYSRFQEPYYPHWRIIYDEYKGSITTDNIRIEGTTSTTTGNPYGDTIVGDDDTTADLVNEVDHDITIGGNQGYIPGLRNIYYK